MYNLTTVIMTLFVGIFFGITISYFYALGKEGRPKVKKFTVLSGYIHESRFCTGVFENKHEALKFSADFLKKYGNEEKYEGLWFGMTNNVDLSDVFWDPGNRQRPIDKEQ